MITDEFLKDRRFSVRFLGRPHTWVWLGGGGALAFLGWYLMALPGRDSPGFQRDWFLWSGNVLLAMFVTTLLLSLRKWSIKLPFFRDLGRAPIGNADACWAAIQRLNSKVAKGAYGSATDILDAAQEVLRKHGVHKIHRPHLVSKRLPGGETLQYVRLEKRDPLGRLEPWVEMHMGLGTVACVGVAVHADFVLRSPLGWVLFVSSMIVLVTGVVGAVLYRKIPEQLASADAGIPFEEATVAQEGYQTCLAGTIGTLDDELRSHADALLAGGANEAQLAARSGTLMSQVGSERVERVEMVRDLLVMAGSRDYLRWNTARARRLDLLLKSWKWVHVPVAVALCFFILLHVVAVIWY